MLMLNYDLMTNPAFSVLCQWGKSFSSYLVPVWFYFTWLNKPFYPTGIGMGREVRFCPSVRVDREQVREKKWGAIYFSYWHFTVTFANTVTQNGWLCGNYSKDSCCLQSFSSFLAEGQGHCIHQKQTRKCDSMSSIQTGRTKGNYL